MSTEVENKTAFVKFEEYHQPTLADGDYEINVTQVVTIENHTEAIGPFTASRHFTVAGERFELKPADVEAVFPPDGNLGDHSNVLPHIVLNRSTLPWERTVNGGLSTGIPWLALLVFDDAEKPEPKKLTVADLLGPQPPGAPKFPTIKLERAQQQDDALTVIDVPYTLLSQIMPTAEELKLLTHVRFGTNAKDELTGEELAIIIANRLPKARETTTAHLVSLENRFQKVEGTSDSYEFNYQGATVHSSIRLVSLKSWSFTCESHEKSFKELLTGLNNQPCTLKLPDNIATAAKFFSEGYVAVPQYFRGGDQNLCWYRGPLIPGRNESVGKSLPARTADALVRYDTEFAMFDVSYAAAWELGRLLALQDKDFSTALYQWKRQQAQRVARDGQRLLHSHLPYQSAMEFSVPPEIATWFASLRKLERVPFNYLVPDDRMLPPESIRFFRVDASWIDCLADGAFSIGRVSSSDHRADRLYGEDSPAAAEAPMFTGVLLRSEVVSGWPGLLVTGFSDKDGKDEHRLDAWRTDRLAPGVLLVIFAGAREVVRVDIYQKPETLHFGFTVDHQHPGPYKKLRDREGNILATKTVILDHWHSAQQRTIDVVAFGKALIRELTPSPSLSSSEFGLQMVESGDKIIFKSS
ncbi:MAG TPA: hypothetical protein VFR51_18800 [Pyrinomonadaceae bacterium]|nr:hypothetical protein [Pyrinomonadaceae bacterium]